LTLTLIATVLTGYGSWSCNFFSGANIGLTGNSYGLWSLQDSSGKCQLWDVLIFGHHLDASLISARAMSMSAMILGFSMLTTLSLANQCHIISWGIGVVFLLLLFSSIFGSKTFNTWITFWLFLYILLVLVIRALFIHPIHRKISARGNWCVCCCMIMCMIFTLATLSALTSMYCTCKGLEIGKLEGRIVDDPCGGPCQLDAGGYLMITSSFFWMLASIATSMFGAQSTEKYSNQIHSTHSDLNSPAISSRDISSSLQLSISKEEDFSNSLTQNECKRTTCQRLCCDLRIEKRTRCGFFLFWLFRITLAVVIVTFIFIILLLIGSRVENERAERAPDTSSNFILDPVCAFNPTQRELPFQTFPNANDAHAAGRTIAHCGHCAFCSNMQDIAVYVQTRKTVAASAKQCGPTSVFGSYDQLLNCLEEKINFSRDCTKCWADNMKSTSKYCLFTCLQSLLNGMMKSNNIPNSGQRGWLNHCLLCDERMSGNAFVTCSGVARRRLGIESEIERNPKELCQSVDINWISFIDSGN
jgi:hypothetical protein